MKTNKTAIAIIIAGLLVAVAVGFTNQKQDRIYIAPEESEVLPANEFREAFMVGCAEDPADTSSCSCIYDEMLSEYGFDGFLDLSIEYVKTNTLPSEVMDVIEKC
jgi:hypothetical protein